MSAPSYFACHHLHWFECIGDGDCHQAVNGGGPRLFHLDLAVDFTGCHHIAVAVDTEKAARPSDVKVFVLSIECGFPDDCQNDRCRNKKSAHDIVNLCPICCLVPCVSKFVRCLEHMGEQLDNVRVDAVVCCFLLLVNLVVEAHDPISSEKGIISLHCHCSCACDPVAWSGGIATRAPVNG